MPPSYEWQCVYSRVNTSLGVSNLDHWEVHKYVIVRYMSREHYQFRRALRVLVQNTNFYTSGSAKIYDILDRGHGELAHQGILYPFFLFICVGEFCTHVCFAAVLCKWCTFKNTILVRTYYNAPYFIVQYNFKIYCLCQEIIYFHSSYSSEVSRPWHSCKNWQFATFMLTLIELSILYLFWHRVNIVVLFLCIVLVLY